MALAGATLIGRSDEVAELEWLLEALPGGPAALSIEGDAGIGKTTLWREGVRRATERGYRVLSCRPGEAEVPLPFAALGDLLEGVADGDLAELPAPQRHALAASMLRVEPIGGTIERRAVSLAVLGVLRRLARHEPLVLGLDDVQWLDPSSSAALRFALRRLDGEQLGVLTTRRSREPAAGHLADFPDGRVRRVRIAALEAQELGRLLLDRLGLPLARPALLRVFRLSAGNPFLALEIGRALQRREVKIEPGQPFPVPLNLRELVRDRLDLLSATGRETGLVIAALVQPAAERVQEVTAAAGFGVGGLDEAVAAGIVEVEGGRVRFTHPLLGSIIYSEASAAQRRGLHALLAGVTDDVEERAAHLALAATGPEANVAETLDVAASRALRRGAPEAAADLLDRAVALTPASDRALRFRRLVDAGKAHARAGDTPAAKHAFRGAASAAHDRRARAEALTRLGSTLLLDWQPEPSRGAGGIDAAHATYEEARREAGDDPSLLAPIELDLAWLHYFAGRRIASSLHAGQAVELAQAAADDECLARSLVTAAITEGRAGNDAGPVLLRRAFRLAKRVRQRQFSDRPEFVHTLFLAADGRLAEARASVLAEYRDALERGDEGSLPTLLEHLAIFERRAGNWEDAERYAREMRDASERSRIVPEYHSAPHAWILALRGDIDRARELAETGRVLADAGGIGPTFGGHRAVLGFVELSCGDARACADVLEPLSNVLTSEIAETGWFRFLADEVEARVELGEVERASVLVEQLSDRRGVLLDAAWARAATERCRGLILGATGDEARSDQAFMLAGREHEHLNEPFELARTLLVQGRVQRRFKRRAAARRSLTHAHAIFCRLGSPLWAARTEEEARRIGGRAPRSSGLTETELRVAELAARGRTNREIAAALFLSVNTVQAHLKRVYREVGVRSRTELARKLPPAAGSKSTDLGVSAE
jgi:DNA-binding CsgD family transcriptional regulator